MPLPSATKLKKKDTDSLESGRAFCPVMFEETLKNFTPDVPNSISGRPRLVRILFLIFIVMLLSPAPKEEFRIISQPVFWLNH